MERGNVLVIGNSGVGKSTLINAVLGKEMAKTGWGSSGTTGRLEIYESSEVPFRIIDTIGFEPSPLKAWKAVRAVKKWSRESVKDLDGDRGIHLIWFCVEGTSSKLFPGTLQNLFRATSMWESVPVIVVITKSYSEPEREKNIRMVERAFEKQKRASRNLRAVIPVVAKTFTLNETAFAPPEGIDTLISATNEAMPEGIRAGEQDVFRFNRKRKRALARSIAWGAAAAATTVGAVPMPVPDGLILTPIEIGEINALARLYGIENNEESRRFLNSIVEAGTVGTAAKAAISAIRAVPGVNLAAGALNAVIAGGMVAAIGEGSIYAFEKVWLGEKSVADINWVTKIMEEKLSARFTQKAAAILKLAVQGDKTDPKKLVAEILTELFRDGGEADA